MRGVEVFDDGLAVNSVDARVGVGQRVGVRDHIHIRKRADVDVGELAPPRTAADRQAHGLGGLSGQDPIGGVNRRLRPVVAGLRLAAPVDQPAQNPQRQGAARRRFDFGVFADHRCAADILPHRLLVHQKDGDNPFQQRVMEVTVGRDQPCPRRIHRQRLTRPGTYQRAALDLAEDILHHQQCTRESLRFCPAETRQIFRGVDVDEL